MKKPTKKELYTKIKEFEQKEIDEATKKEQEFATLAMHYYDGARAFLEKKLRAAFGGAFTLVKFEHVDGAGFWFSFELIQDKTRQTYRINHEEAKAEFLQNLFKGGAK